MAPVNRKLGLISVALLIGAALGIMLIPAWTSWDLRPGSPLGQTLGISAGILLLGTLRYLVIRRSDRPDDDKPNAQRLHALVGSVGVALALVHSQATLREWSALVLLAAVGLLVSGLYGRLVAPRRVAGHFGADAIPYLATDAGVPSLPDDLRQRLDDKRRILRTLDPAGREATFVLRLSHWLARPRQAWQYWRLARGERSIHGRQAESAVARLALAERVWRRSHLVLAVLFVIGLIAHIATVLFFAGYVANGRDIYWWHFTAW
jgi:hypothetical protein